MPRGFSMCIHKNEQSDHSGIYNNTKLSILNIIVTVIWVLFENVLFFQNQHQKI